MQLYATVQPQESALADFNTALWLKHPADLGRQPDPVRAGPAARQDSLSESVARKSE